MLFRKQKRTGIRELNLRISNDAIQSVNDFNFLGLHINSKLSPTPGAPNRGGVGGVSTPPEFWMGG